MTDPIQEILRSEFYVNEHEDCDDSCSKKYYSDQAFLRATQAIKDLILKEIIGDDEKHKNGQTLVNPWVCDDCGTPEESYARNALRATQRAKLGVDNERR